MSVLGSSQACPPRSHLGCERVSPGGETGRARIGRVPSESDKKHLIATDPVAAAHGICGRLRAYPTTRWVLDLPPPGVAFPLHPRRDHRYSAEYSPQTADRSAMALTSRTRGRHGARPGPFTCCQGHVPATLEQSDGLRGTSSERLRALFVLDSAGVPRCGGHRDHSERDWLFPSTGRHCDQWQVGNVGHHPRDPVPWSTSPRAAYVRLPRRWSSVVPTRADEFSAQRGTVGNVRSSP